MRDENHKNKHENYETLNLIGYGLAKFSRAFIKEYGFKTKTAFYQHIVDIGIADTVGTVKNRQDLFDPFFDNGRKGWWQRGVVIGLYLYRLIRYYMVLCLHETKPICRKNWCHLQDCLPYVQAG